MDNTINLKTMLKQLNKPYKKSKAYEAFGDVTPKDTKNSMFWNSTVDYVVAYENVGDNA